VVVVVVAVRVIRQCQYRHRRLLAGVHISHHGMDSERIAKRLRSGLQRDMP
jgi:hypothetical protein